MKTFCSLHGTSLESKEHGLVTYTREEQTWLHILVTQCFRSTQPGPCASISRDLDLSKNNLITHSHYLHATDAILIIDSCSSVSRRFCQKRWSCQLIIVSDVCRAVSTPTTRGPIASPSSLPKWEPEEPGSLTQVLLCSAGHETQYKNCWRFFDGESQGYISL